jgi:hypothetical protein
MKGFKGTSWGEKHPKDCECWTCNTEEKERRKIMRQKIVNIFLILAVASIAWTTAGMYKHVAAIEKAMQAPFPGASPGK